MYVLRASLASYCFFTFAHFTDVDHSGVPNSTLIAEGSPLAKVYQNKSVAEQNSIDIAWDCLMEKKYENLRRQIYTTESEFKRFRQLVVSKYTHFDVFLFGLRFLRFFLSISLLFLTNFYE